MEDLPEVADDQGGFASRDSLVSIPSRLTERADRPVALDVYAVSCHLTVITGFALAKVDHVTLLRADHTTTRLRLRAAPKGWHYAGHMIGSIVRSPSSRLIFARPFDRAGHVMQPIKLHTRPC